MLDPGLRWAKTFKLPGMFLLALYLVVRINHAAQIFLIHDSTATRAITAEKRVFVSLTLDIQTMETGRGGRRRRATGGTAGTAGQHRKTEKERRIY